MVAIFRKPSFQSALQNLNKKFEQSQEVMSAYLAGAQDLGTGSRGQEEAATFDAFVALVGASAIATPKCQGCLAGFGNGFDVMPRFLLVRFGPMFRTIVFWTKVLDQLFALWAPGLRRHVTNWQLRRSKKRRNNRLPAARDIGVLGPTGGT